MTNDVIVPVIDSYGHIWRLPKSELCSECGQPDNTGDCNHKKLTDAEAKKLGAIDPPKGE